MKKFLAYAALVTCLILTYLLVYTRGHNDGVAWYKQSKYMQFALESAFQLGKASNCQDKTPYFLDETDLHEHH